MNKAFILNDRYEIIDHIGKGGMADVYLADDRYLNRKVAIKILRLDFRSNTQAQKRFQQEAMAASELDNNHIVGMYDVDEDDGIQYLVMEFVDGQNLKQYIKERFPIPYAEVVDIMEQLCSAVGEAHNHNIIHRDLKPQNVLIDDEKYVKITDFGISRAESKNTMTQTRNIIGSIHYLSPEQIKGSMATRQSDIYSLGIILYELLTGKVPFDGESAISIAIQHSQSPIPSVREFDPRIPQALENVVLKATTKDPNERYQNVEDMMKELDVSLDDANANVAKFISNDINEDDDETKVMPFMPINDEKKDNEKSAPTTKIKNVWIVIALIAILIIFFSGFFLAKNSKIHSLTIPNKDLISNIENVIISKFNNID